MVRIVRVVVGKKRGGCSCPLCVGGSLRGWSDQLSVAALPSQPKHPNLPSQYFTFLLKIMNPLSFWPEQPQNISHPFLHSFSFILKNSQKMRIKQTFHFVPESKSSKSKKLSSSNPPATGLRTSRTNLSQKVCHRPQNVQNIQTFAINGNKIIISLPKKMTMVSTAQFYS